MTSSIKQIGSIAGAGALAMLLSACGASDTVDDSTAAQPTAEPTVQASDLAQDRAVTFGQQMAVRVLNAVQEGELSAVIPLAEIVSTQSRVGEVGPWFAAGFVQFDGIRSLAQAYDAILADLDSDPQRLKLNAIGPAMGYVIDNVPSAWMASIQAQLVGSATEDMFINVVAERAAE